MPSKDFIFPLESLDFNTVIADIEEIRRHNAQRFEMEQLTAIIHEDKSRNACAGYKDITNDEFWVRGHMPSLPLMPGVVMLESVAQMCSYFAHKHELLGDGMVGFGGLEDVRFRDPVLPGDRLIVMCELIKARKNRMIVCRFQGVVGTSMVLEGILKGIQIPANAIEQLTAERAARSS